MMTRPQHLGQRLTATTKRAFDIFIAGAMLIFFAPLFLTIAFLIRRRGDGPIIFSHPRIGRKGRTFRCLKFRTMVPDADKRLAELLSSNPHLSQQWQSQCKLDPDPRVIPGIGEFLRRSSLDELPQLWNVLMGDMSIVGPRPVTEAELSRYGDYVDHYLAVRPGLTGPWQIGGRSDMNYVNRVEADVRYVETVSLPTDLSILLKTIAYFLTGRLTGGR